MGKLELSSRDGSSLCDIRVVEEAPTERLPTFFKQCHKEFKSFLTGKTQSIDIPLDHQGLTNFQKQVLKEMKKIPYGKVRSYKDIARPLGIQGYQAIGSACGRNPFLLIYPCHRVVGTNGPGGFAHGLEMKRRLLELEGFKL